ncbi:recombinase RecB [Paraoerskovia sediminicola]|uniref:Recombinase RecB n=1 Tax=Paraoerskovia sediminicola TaxID=1138587 RepID=A0ABM8G5V2_9CELL|nr:PD-(D/E)XK nuclease family protein [Paraoerskovia sediminicola]BDZ43508.1 recombinase RecB [Paraoerskovia sediminicola]
MQCPQLFRFRSIDRLPEPPSEAATRGTLIHAVLERLYDAPLGERTLAAAVALLRPQWAVLQETDERCVDLFDDEASERAWLLGAEQLLATYFTLEDPNRLEPESRELRVETELEQGPAMRGIVDRIDVAPDGAVRVVDYKSGKSPREGYEGSALFQMRFYGLVLWRERGVLPKMLQLVYLGDGRVLRAEPTQRELEITEQKVRSLWASIQDAARTGQWSPRRSRLCDWCAHKTICPAFGGTPPEVSPEQVERTTGVRPAGSGAGAATDAEPRHETI